MSLIDQWRATPRVVKIAVGGGLIVAICLGAMPVFTWRNSIENRAYKLDSALRKRAEYADDKSQAGSALATIHEKLGTPNPPSKLKSEAFARVVDGILDHNEVSERSVSERKVRLARDTSDALGMGPIDRLILEITFEAKPETVFAILSDLEKSPEVAAVARVRIDKSNSRDEAVQTVRATIAPEAWVLSADSSTPGSSGSPEVIP